MFPRVRLPDSGWDCVLPRLFAFTVFGLGLLVATPFFTILLAPFYMASI
jgi:hypothetical protein